MCASYGKLAIFKEGDQSFTAYCYWKGQCYGATLLLPANQSY